MAFGGQICVLVCRVEGSKAEGCYGGTHGATIFLSFLFYCKACGAMAPQVRSNYLPYFAITRILKTNVTTLHSIETTDYRQGVLSR